MRAYLSYGGGVNSTALMLLLKREGVDFEAVFADHGGDYPETYEYIRYLHELGHPITVIKPNASGCSTIEEYALKYRILPSMQVRWCTRKFKIEPLMNYYEKPCIEYIGFSADERRRADRYHRTTWRRWKRGTEVRFPLVKRGITRQGCINIIKDAGLQVPIASGCWFCPFMSKLKIRKLYATYPDLYARRKRMEAKSVERGGFYFGHEGRPMSAIAPESMPPLERWSEKARGGS